MVRIGRPGRHVGREHGGTAARVGDFDMADHGVATPQHVGRRGEERRRLRLVEDEVTDQKEPPFTFCVRRIRALPK